ncbi:hypothetical protein AXG89_29470 (plasmid) [Burkholderia sp. PAMC 26561]|nr:hypothetical protein AXG89_23210 [Burkholderia sp. PAMC 26561]AME27959.1 hypothetical protein AXG89_29470 [Burkholderia sp. PAMC 26561]
MMLISRVFLKPGEGRARRISRRLHQTKQQHIPAFANCSGKHDLPSHTNSTPVNHELLMTAGQP